ncbi:MAG: hypothetical protein APG12_01120 [Candidatus Methanofastidiosum methylothiophilum]|uniref:Adhesin domain-containing protein n=1 Tax=Candidatus Methanofastidiosum methylothiophilum TaxID=1705564 RepID=A0A150IPH1_9EURY|nr:MAG: hypothetical protein APG10_01652 [Candidatus Methanofastidiosum methylthiophilus]KYC46715.1 MAG: hypothetical protein APG11_01717 [Candidatus Methanofastidiosum methylthiophilus]KYC49946.1 MAG: hypothetical protein APG12_01120 [Candidatus Methanofastidiosum methylthiophilus]
MNAEGHLFISGVLNIIFLGILYLLGVNVFQMGILFLILIVFVIFSLLPDIDHPRSRISGIFYLAMIIIIIASGISFVFTFNLINILGILFAIGMLFLHGKYAEDSYNHRKFPHTIKFCLIVTFILFFLLNSWVANATYISIITLVGAISIFSHIWVDKYMYDTFLHFKNNVNYSVEITPEIASEKNVSTKFNAVIVRNKEWAIQFKLSDSKENVWIPKREIKYMKGSDGSYTQPEQYLKKYNVNNTNQTREKATYYYNTTGYNVVYEDTSNSRQNSRFNQFSYQDIDYIFLRNTNEDLVLNISKDNKIYLEGDSSRTPRINNRNLYIENLEGAIFLPINNPYLKIDIQVVNGDITGNLTHSGSIRSVNGDINLILNASLNVQTNTVNGDIYVNPTLLNNSFSSSLYLETINGSIVVT